MEDKDILTKKDMLKAIELLLTQQGNGYHLEKSDLKEIKKSIEIINNAYKQATERS